MSETMIRIRSLGKMYRLYQRPLGKVADAFGLGNLPFLPKAKYQEFWALRDVSLTLKKGGRIGIIGRNGAGKSTLLKIICGNLEPTEGECEVNGEIQALMDMGTAFHPEFTGRQNIHASLSYQRFSTAKIREAEGEIIEFTELEEFIDQPVKTYSLGMYARLAFAVATAITPDLLIIDEVMGAGDAYFAARCAAKMKALVEDNGATVLLVSHSTEQILRYCEHCIWLERGQVVRQGPSMEIVDAYLEFIHELEDRRLKAKNLKRRLGVRSNDSLGNLSESLVLCFRILGQAGGWSDVSEVALLRDGETEEKLTVGGIQDADAVHTAAVYLQGSQWSEPRREDDVCFRRLTCVEDAVVVGYISFDLYALDPKANYAFSIRYRCCDGGQLAVTGVCNGSLMGKAEQPLPSASGWTQRTISFDELRAGAESQQGAPRATKVVGEPEKEKRNRPVSRWSGEGSLMIEEVLLLGGDGSEQTVFAADGKLTLRITVKAHRSGSYDLLPTATLFRMDGICVSNFIATPHPLVLAKGDTRQYEVELDPILLGDGHYVFSVAIYEKEVDTETMYDTLNRSFEFKVTGNTPEFAWCVFKYQSTWRALQQEQRRAG